MAEVAVSLHEVFVSLVAGGFTDEQALSVIARLMFLHQTGVSDA
jgi:hypothetical protein